MTYRDLRDYIDQVEGLNELRRIENADWNLEIGALTEVAANLPTPPALLFDKIKSYPDGFRVFTNGVRSTRKACLALQIDTALEPVAALKAWMNKRKFYSPKPPRHVSTGPISENEDTGDKVDVFKFPVPIWHEKDGGRYIGSDAVSIMEDPDEHWINAAIYRIMIHDKSTLALHVDHLGRHGAIIAQRYWDKGKDCPIVIVCGADPALFLAASEPLPWGQSEFDFAGWIKGEPFEVTNGKETGLPIPARAEIVIEGMMPPVSAASLPEGPFGEFTGYYASGITPAFAVKIRSVSYRSAPILTGSPPLKPPAATLGLPIPAASVWSDIEKVGISDVTGVWQHVYRLFTVISIKERYSGHAMRAGLVAAASSGSGYIGRFIVLVDEDVDVTNVGDVLWAISTRCEPEEDIHLIRDGWSSPLDPRISPEKREKGDFANSKVIINACRPLEWRTDFPIPNRISDELKQQIEKKWLNRLHVN